MIARASCENGCPGCPSASVIAVTTAYNRVVAVPDEPPPAPMSSASELIVPPTSGRWVRRLVYAAGATALLVLAVWVAVPPIARAQLESRLTKATGRATTVESVAFDLYGLRLVVRNLVIADKTAQRPLFALDELVADVSAASLWHRAPVFDAVKLTRPRMLLARDRDGRYNVQDLVDRALAPVPPGPPPQFSFNNIEIDDGAITLDDRLADRHHEIGALTIAVPFVSSLPHETAVRVTPHIEGTLNGARFALKGSPRRSRSAVKRRSTSTSTRSSSHPTSLTCRRGRRSISPAAR